MSGAFWRELKLLVKRAEKASSGNSAAEYNVAYALLQKHTNDHAPDHAAAIRQQSRDLAELRAELAAAVDEMRDAERYRWLRRKVYVVGPDHLHDNDCGQFEFANLPRILEPMAGVGSASEALDAVIDAALLEIKQ